jgi:DNA-binding MarR family transcriptional regulator
MPASTAPSPDDSRERLAELPPSAKLVATVLELEGSMTSEAIAEEALLPVRTTRYALSRLEEAGLVERRVHIGDARKRVYALCEE